VFDDPQFNGRDGRGGITWAHRSAMGPLRGVLDAADSGDGRNRYMHRVHSYALRQQLAAHGRRYENALDFGCGTGRFLPLLSHYARQVYGFDRSPEMANAARTYNPHFADAIVAEEAGHVPFADGAFDLILCFCVLSVTSFDLAEVAYDELGRVCRSSGTLLLCEKVFDDEPYTVGAYRAALSKRGFSVRKNFAIRSGTSKFTKYGSIDWVGPRVSGWLACAEVHLTGARRYSSTAGSYVEELFICERG